MRYKIPLALISRQLSFSFLSVILFFTTQQVFSATTKDYDDSGSGEDMVPSGKGWGEQQGHKSQELANFPGKGARGGKGSGGPGGKSSNGISYHGGPLITSNTNIYYIYYGDWTNNTGAQLILSAFAKNIGGSPYFNINTTYYDGSGQQVQNSSSSPSLLDSNIIQATDSSGGYYPFGTSLTDTNIKQIVSGAINTIGSDPNGVYFVLTSPDVNESSGFCTKYCGWHTHATIAGIDTKYSFVGNPERCPSACEEQTTSPNGNAGADGMTSIIAHELEEAVTDPDLNAWYDSRGRENADKCAWKFGTTQTASNGSLYNMTLGSNKYLIQQNWLNAGGGGCTLAYP